MVLHITLPEKTARNETSWDTSIQLEHPPSQKQHSQPSPRTGQQRNVWIWSDKNLLRLWFSVATVWCCCDLQIIQQQLLQLQVAEAGKPQSEHTTMCRLTFIPHIKVFNISQCFTVALSCCCHALPAKWPKADHYIHFFMQVNSPKKKVTNQPV